MNAYFEYGHGNITLTVNADFTTEWGPLGESELELDDIEVTHEDGTEYTGDMGAIINEAFAHAG